MSLRDHEPIIIDEFNGLWRRGVRNNTPLDHFQDCENIKISSGGDVLTRDGIGPAQNVVIPVSSIKRIYNYPTQNGNTLIALSFVGGVGFIYHIVNSTLTFGPILSIPQMSDFAFAPYAGRAYISPFTTFPIGGLNVEKGLENEFVYVYKGDGTPARKAAGLPLTGTLTIANGAAGHTDAGLHIFGFVGETDTGYLTPPGALTTFTTISTNSVSFGNVPIGQSSTTVVGQFFPFNAFLNIDDQFIEENILVNDPSVTPITEELLIENEDKILSLNPVFHVIISNSPNIIKRHLVASKMITGFNGNLEGYQLFFVPGAVINNNTDTFLNNISFFDQDLVDDASHLFDNLSEIPACAVLTTYHNRLVAMCSFNDISLGYVSHPGEPEAISGVDGLIIMPLDGNPITNGAELRDVLYTTKRSRTGSFTDNGDEPSTWPYTIIDNALGTSVHGIGTVLDSGATNVDFLIISTYQGLTLFNGRYIVPELSWKIEDYWKALDRNEFRKIQIVNAPIQKDIYIVLPTGDILIGDYAVGMEPKKIRWYPWSFNVNIVSVAIWQIDEVLIGADL